MVPILTGKCNTVRLIYTISRKHGLKWQLINRQPGHFYKTAKMAKSFPRNLYSIRQYPNSLDKTGSLSPTIRSSECEVLSKKRCLPCVNEPFEEEKLKNGSTMERATDQMTPSDGLLACQPKKGEIRAFLPCKDFFLPRQPLNTFFSSKRKRMPYCHSWPL